MSSVQKALIPGKYIIKELVDCAVGIQPRGGRDAGGAGAAGPRGRRGLVRHSLHYRLHVSSVLRKGRKSHHLQQFC